MTRYRLNLIPARWVFILFLLVISVTTLLVFISGLSVHRSILQNGLISLSLISCCFFIFISAGLFFGVKLKDNVGDFTKNIKWTGSGDGFELADEGLGMLGFELGEGLGGILLGILWWFCATFLFVALLFFFETILWAVIMILLAMMYWVFYRALRLVFIHSPSCRGKIGKSSAYGILYTLLYSVWFYAILYFAF